MAIIPARYGSSRLPGKPLAPIGGKPMIQHVYENACKATALDRVIVATDDRRIQLRVREFGGDVVMTSKAHMSGTDRLAEVARKLRCEWVVNVQGDLPFIQPETITRAVRPLRRDHTIAMGTVSTPIYNEEEWRNPNVVKVVTDRRGYALYFSRAPLPYVRNAGIPLDGAGRARRVWGQRHLGLYVYRREFLLRFARLRPAALEQIESLEQLRALAHGYGIFVVPVREAPVEVDTSEDLVRAERFLNQAGG